MRDSNDALDKIWLPDDHLDRRADADYLGKYLGERYVAKPKEEGFVLALNASWGVGKTFMLTKWCAQLRHQEHPVVYFDAWANDFTSEPLIAFIAELNEGLKERFKTMPVAKRKLAGWIEEGKKAVIPTLKAVGGVAIKQATGFSVGTLLDVALDDDSSVHAQPHRVEPSKVAEQLSKAVDAALKNHVTTRKAISACRQKLEGLVDYLETVKGVQLPIYVIVDELDRCRPDYAIQLLEGIKHLFGVRGVYFVIGTNISQLSHSIAAVYGEKFDGESYLKRFFDLEYSLPNPDLELFATELLKGLIWRPEGEQLVTGFRDEFGIKPPGSDYLPFLFAKYAEWFGLSLRDQVGAERILDAALQGLKGKKIHIHFLLFLVMLFQRSAETYSHVAAYREFNSKHDALLKATAPYTRYLNLKQIDDKYNWKSTRVDLVNLINLYLAYIQTGNGPNNANDFEFPSRLMLTLHNHSQQKIVDVAKYFSIVRQAGRFSNRT